MEGEGRPRRRRQGVKPSRYEDEEDHEQHLRSNKNSSAVAILPPHQQFFGGVTNSSDEEEKRYSKLPTDSTNILEQWILSNRQNPYPSKEEKEVLIQSTGLRKKQIESWMEKYRRVNNLGSRTLPTNSTAILEQWIQSNVDNPYPTKETKEGLVQSTGLRKKQIESWLEKVS